jgi:hypothetical protein
MQGKSLQICRENPLFGPLFFVYNYTFYLPTGVLVAGSPLFLPKSWAITGPRESTMNEQPLIQDLLHQIEHLTSVYHVALRGKGDLGIMMNYLNRKGLAYDISSEEKSIDPLVCPLFKETMTNELEYLYTQAKTVTRHEIASLACVPTP